MTEADYPDWLTPDVEFKLDPPEDDRSALDIIAAASDQLRDEIDQLIGAWLPVFNQEHRDVTRIWLREGDLANCEHDTEYDEVKLGFNVARITAEVEPDNLNELVAHEIAHIPTWPIWAMAMDVLDRLAEEKVAKPDLEYYYKKIKEAGENTTTQVHRAVMRAFNAGRRYERGSTQG